MPRGGYATVGVEFAKYGGGALGNADARYIGEL